MQLDKPKFAASHKKVSKQISVANIQNRSISLVCSLQKTHEFEPCKKKAMKQRKFANVTLLGHMPVRCNRREKNYITAQYVYFHFLASPNIFL
jgi:hypothetical protein